jgi:hypothetical protein
MLCCLIKQKNNFTFTITTYDVSLPSLQETDCRRYSHIWFLWEIFWYYTKSMNLAVHKREILIGNIRSLNLTNTEHPFHLYVSGHTEFKDQGSLFCTRRLTAHRFSDFEEQIMYIIFCSGCFDGIENFRRRNRWLRNVTLCMFWSDFFLIIQSREVTRFGNFGR